MPRHSATPCSASAVRSPSPSPSPCLSPSAASASSPSSSHGGTALSAQSLHELAVQAFRIGNRGRLSLCEALRALNETRCFLELGFPSLPAYADAFFQLRRAETFEHVRVATVLTELTELREAFGRGQVGWSALKAITRVASQSSQTSWIGFARENRVERTLSEARDALRQRRDRPRDASFGLPNLDQRLVLRFSRSDMDRVRNWIEDTCTRIAEKTGAENISVEQAILFLCEHEAAICPPGPSPIGESRGDRGPDRARVVYQRCPECRRGRVGTRDGFVEVAPEEIDCHEGCADAVVIDGPTPPTLRRRILAREGDRCGDPRCHHSADHCHHIVFRSRGGRTELANEVAVCTTCHALIHAGLLRMSGRSDEELRWLPVAAAESLVRSVEAACAEIDRLPSLQLEMRTRTDEHPTHDSRESAIADSEFASAKGNRTDAGTSPVDIDGLSLALTRLGVPAARSRRMIEAAIGALPCRLATEANVLRRAIASI